MTIQAQSSKWSRRFVLAAAVFLVAWQVVLLADLSYRTGIVLGLLGFVFHTIFGKAYSLIPTYFDRELETARLMPVHFGFALVGTVALAFGIEFAHATARTIGALSWAAGVAVFLGTIGWTIRDNLTGAETATSEQKADRRPVDRAANAFIPIALGYLAMGSYELLAMETGLPLIFDGYWPRVVHLLAAGTGALLVFAIGFRLLPRFLVAKPPQILVAAVLPAGAIAPLVLAAELPAGDWLVVGALLQSIAVAGFALAFWILFYRSERRRVGFYGVLVGTVAGIAGIGLGLMFAFDGPTAELIAAHRRLNVLGFLGLAIVGVSYQFYPPAVGTYPGAGDRTAIGIITVLGGGLALEVLGRIVTIELVVVGGQLLVLVGAAVHCYLLAGLFRERYG
jgi:hypothetical protein